jgi:4-amino-4-deoxy-L-arabinose transferase-like glycosyltransferase
MKDLNLLIILFFACFILIQLIIPQNYQLNADEGTHALIGLFYKDLIMNISNFHSFNDITKFAVDYVVKYPKISVHYPPLYHILIAFIFLISESFFLIRIFNILLTVLTSFIIYKLNFELINNKNVALMSVVFFLSFIIIFYYTDKIMMDILQILTFSIVLLFYLKLRNEKKISLLNIIIFSFLLAISFLTKFFSIFLPIIIFIDLFFHNRKLIPYVILSMILSLVIISPYIFVYVKFKFYKVAFNVSQTPQIVQILHEQTKLNYFDVFTIFGIFVGPLVAISIIWFIWKNFKNPLIMSWFFIPLFMFLFLFKDIEFRFLFILMPIYSVACSLFVFQNMRKIRSNKRKKLLFGFVVIILFLQFISDVYITYQNTYYGVDVTLRNINKDGNVYSSVNDIMKNINKDGNVLILSEEPIYSSVYILYSRVNNIKGNFIRPCILDQNNLTKDFLNNWGIKYIIDQNNTVNENLKNSLNLNLFKEIRKNNVSINVFEVKDIVNKFDCNFICVLQKKVCKGQDMPDVFTN